ncbi:hypothetical protein PL9214670008 [Planktothrix tepida PCC 9214]|uniref:Uncharacterized protein n=1 Tax=Planktothrix tepida PCC 9214 TaxID=671072 RepID=A0A1J1LT41_9CYAN|nr:hypothetical protein [Planktothrix tepida]CUR35382.1 hypothetical protein PL9214670008 [Planktothrix tepida PCC 9214]
MKAQNFAYLSESKNCDRPAHTLTLQGYGYGEASRYQNRVRQL